MRNEMPTFNHLRQLVGRESELAFDLGRCVCVFEENYIIPVDSGALREETALWQGCGVNPKCRFSHVSVKQRSITLKITKHEY